MFRRLLSTNLKSLALSSSRSPPFVTATRRFISPSSTTSFGRSSSVFTRLFSSMSENVASKPKRVEDVMPIATGHESEELEAELEGRNILEIDYPVGPFGTKENPAVVKSYYDRRIVGCPGGEGEDEHDVVWFWLEKDKPFECPVCSQCFKLKVEGPGGDWEAGHGEHEHH